MKMETMNSKIIWPWAILAVLLLAGCYSTERLSEQNLAYIYDRKATVLSPSFRVRHLNDTVSVLDFRIPSNELLYLQNATSGFFSAEFRMRYEIYGQLESRMLVDSAVVLFKDSVLSLTDRAIEGTLRFKPSRSKAGLLKIDLIDLKRNARVRQYIPIDRTSYNCRQFFNVLEADSAPLFSNVVSLQQKVVISHASGASEAKVRYYERDFPLPNLHSPWKNLPRSITRRTAHSVYHSERQ
jgi:hypothetical protein